MERNHERAGFRVEGRVQGVGFRWWTRAKAVQLGLEGSVRNLRDGAVEVHATGRRDLLERLNDLLRRGPPGARVEAVHIIPAEPRLATGPFRIEL